MSPHGHCASWAGAAGNGNVVCCDGLPHIKAEIRCAGLVLGALFLPHNHRSRFRACQPAVLCCRHLMQNICDVPTADRGTVATSYARVATCRVHCTSSGTQAALYIWRRPGRPRWVSPLTMRRNGDLASYANAIALTCSCSRSSCQRAQRYTLLRMATLQEAVAYSKLPDGCASLRTENSNGAQSRSAHSLPLRRRCL